MANWPPPTAPSWPPPGYERVEAYNLEGLWATLVGPGTEWTIATPSGQERAAFFNAASCEEGHNLLGRMLVSPDGLTRYPFAVCNNAANRRVLVLWPPYEWAV